MTYENIKTFAKQALEDIVNRLGGSTSLLHQRNGNK